MAGLEDLYREIILDHYRAPRNRGELPVPPAHKAEGFNPLCGDEVVLYLEVDGDTVTDLKIAGQGCSISQASTSMMSAAVKGKSVDEARKAVEKARRSDHSLGDDSPAIALLLRWARDDFDAALTFARSLKGQQQDDEPAIERRPQILLVDHPHQREVLGRFAGRPVIARAPCQPQ